MQHQLGVDPASGAADGTTMIRPLRTASAPPIVGVPGSIDAAEISAQALHLHAVGLIVTARSGRGGLIGRDEAEQLAERCGALVSELVDAGLWTETDLCYIVRVGILARTTPTGEAHGA